MAQSTQIEVRDLGKSAMERVFRRLGDALIELEAENGDILDHAVSTDLALRILEVDVTVVGDTEAEASERADSTIREAVRRSGGRVNEATAYGTEALRLRRREPVTL